MKPDPANVSGKVVETHAFEHSVTWNVSHIVIAAVALYAVVKFAPALR